MRKLLAIFFLLPVILCAQTQESRTTLYSEIDTQLASGQPITAAQLRATLKDLVASAHNILADGTALVSSGSYADPSWITSLAWSKLTGKPSFATVATSGLYSDLIGTPTLATVAATGAYSDLTGKPTLGTAAAKDIPATGDATTAQVVFGTDSRLTNARTPTAHAASHAAAGSDPLTLSESQITGLTTDLAAKVPTTTTVNGHALSSNVAVTAGDVGNTTAQWNANQINGTALSGLATGLLKNTTTTGVPSIAVAGTDYVAPTTTVNGHPLSSNVVVTAGDVGAVPTTTTVNGHALSTNVTVTQGDVGLPAVTNDAQTKAAVMPNTPPAAGQIPVGNAGGTAYAPVPMSGDGTLSSTGALTVTKTNGSAFAASATTDTTNAANISSGTLPAARLPNTTVTAGSYTSANITVGADGRITAASNGTGGGGSGWTSGLITTATVSAATNTVAETTVFSVTIPAGTLGTNKAVHVVFPAQWTNNSGAGANVQLRIKYGATVLYDSTSGSATSNANPRPFVCSFSLLGDGTTSAQRLVGETLYMGTAGAPASGYGLWNNAPLSRVFGFGGTAAEDSTVDQTLAITVTMSSASNTLFQGLTSIVEKL